MNYIQAQPAVFPVPAVPPNHYAPAGQAIGADEKYCFSCGSPVKKAAARCPRCGVDQSARNSAMAVDVYCTSCGRSIKKEASVCPFCGVMQGVSASSGYPPGYVPKEHTAALLLCIFLGFVGGHRFYVGKIGTAILMIVSSVTIIVPIIWWIIDLVQICTGKFTDKQGYLLKKN